MSRARALATFLLSGSVRDALSRAGFETQADVEELSPAELARGRSEQESFAAPDCSV
jgi:hypothetical protein